MGVAISAAGLPPARRWNSQIPETSARIAVSSMICGMRRRASAGSSLAASGPASPSAGMRKKTWNTIIPTHRAAKTT